MGDTEKTEEIEKPQPSEGDQPAAPVDPDKVVVTEEDLESEPKPGETPQQAEDRKSRRSERRELKETLKQTQARLEEMSRRVEELTARSMAQPPQYAPPQYTQQVARPEASTEEAEIASIETTQAAVIAAIRNPQLPEAQVEAYNKEWHRLERRKQKIIGKEAARETYRELGADTSDEAIQTRILQNEFPDIYANPVLRAHAAAEFELLVHNFRRPRNSSATAREALMNIRQRITRPTAPAPTDNQKARYTSTPGRAGAPTNGSSGEITLTRAQMNAARGFTQHLNDLSDKQRAAIWIREVGKPSGLIP